MLQSVDFQAPPLSASCQNFPQVFSILSDGSLDWNLNKKIRSLQEKHKNHN